MFITVTQSYSLNTVYINVAQIVAVSDLSGDRNKTQIVTTASGPNGPTIYAADHVLADVRDMIARAGAHID